MRKVMTELHSIPGISDVLLTVTETLGEGELPSGVY